MFEGCEVGQRLMLTDSWPSRKRIDWVWRTAFTAIAPVFRKALQSLKWQCIESLEVVFVASLSVVYRST
jgi:hypothetical protein